MFTILGTLISGVLSGGATGLLGVLLQRWFDLKSKDKDIILLRLQHEQAVALATLEYDRAVRRAEADEYKADRELDAAEASADSKSLVASYENDQATYLDKSAQGSKFAIIAFTVVDTIRGLVRPLLTVYLVVLATFMFIWAKDMAGSAAFTPDQAMNLVGQVVATLLYLTTACSLWWFGGRPPKK